MDQEVTPAFKLGYRIFANGNIHVGIVLMTCPRAAEDGNVSLTTSDAKLLGAALADYALAAELKARVMAGDLDAAAEADEQRKRWDNDALNRLYGTPDL